MRGGRDYFSNLTGGGADFFDDDDAFNTDFDFDENGNVVEANKPSSRKRKVKINVTRPGAGVGIGLGVAPQLSIGESDEAATAMELVDKIRQVTEKLDYYKERVRTMKGRETHLKKGLKELHEQIRDLNAEIEMGNLGGDKFGGLKGQTRLLVQSKGGDRTRSDIRKQLYGGIDLLEADAAEDRTTNLGWFKRTVESVKGFISGLLPLQGDIDFVAGRFGSSVASYFKFFRWIVLQSMLVGVITAFFFAQHIAQGDYKSTEFVNVYLPRLVVMSSFTTSEAIDYAGLLLVVHAVMILVAMNKWIREDLEGKAITMFEKDGQLSGRGPNDDDDKDLLEAERMKKKFSKMLLNAWDHTRLETQDLRMSLGQGLQLAMHENEVLKEISGRSLKQKLSLYARRSFGMLLSLCVLAAAAGVIITLTITSSQLESQIASTVFAPFAAFLVPVSVSLLNAMQPPIIIMISKFERWDDPGRQVKYTVWRLFTAKLLNVLLQVISFSLLADPYLLRGRTFGFDLDFLNVRTSTEKTFQDTSYRCRADQAGAGLFQLVLAEFVIGKILAVVFPYIMMGLALVKRVVLKSTKHYVQPQFDVAKSMVNLLYFTQLSLMALPLCPFASMLNCILFFANFKFEKWAVTKYFVKPVKPWSAKDAGAFFVKFYLLSLLVALGGVTLLLTNKSFPKQCDVMDTVIVDLYSGTDPYCSHIDTLRPQILAATTATERQTLAALAGGEVDYWLAQDALCPAQCQTVFSLTLEECRTKCSNLENIHLACDVATPVLDSGNMKTANLTKPCDLSCGPFVSQVNVVAVLTDFFTTNRGTLNVLRNLYLASQEPVVLWAVCILLLVFACFKWNSLSVVQRLSVTKQRAALGEIGRLRRKVAKMSKQLHYRST